jgi:hypothetical protein
VSVTLTLIFADHRLRLCQASGIPAIMIMGGAAMRGQARILLSLYNGAGRFA